MLRVIISFTPIATSLTITKREILRWFSGIFDPLGYISPVTISAKLFLQQLWQKHVDWDTPLNADLSTEWPTIATSITEATTFPFLRKYIASIPPPENTSTNFRIFAERHMEQLPTYNRTNSQPHLWSQSWKQHHLSRFLAVVLAARLSDFIRTLTIHFTCGLIAKLSCTGSLARRSWNHLSTTG